MKTEFLQPPTDTASPRRPVIRASSFDPYRDASAPSYLQRFEVTMERAFLAAFRQVEKRGGHL